MVYNPSTTEYAFIDKEMWLSLDDPQGSGTCNGGRNSCWIEAGDTAGVIKQNTGDQMWQGHYFAIARDDGSYYEEPIGTSGETGSHTFEIAYGANAVWEIYVDGTLMRQITSMSQFRWGFALQSGIESNNDQNSFTSGTSQTSLEWRDQTATWYYWDAVNPYSGDTMVYLTNAHSVYQNATLSFQHS